MPDSLIHIILLFLGTRDVITTLLSKRWNDTLPYLHFRKSSYIFWYESDADYFRNFVNGGLALWRGAKIMKFSLDFEFDLQLFLFFFEPKTGFHSPSSASMNSLRLFGIRKNSDCTSSVGECSVIRCRSYGAIIWKTRGDYSIPRFINCLYKWTHLSFWKPINSTCFFTLFEFDYLSLYCSILLIFFLFNLRILIRDALLLHVYEQDGLFIYFSFSLVCVIVDPSEKKGWFFFSKIKLVVGYGPK